MISENIISIIEKLSEKTHSNLVEWNKSSGVDGFKLVLKVGSISIDKFFTSDENCWIMDLTILNERGETIERYLKSQVEEVEGYNYLETFYSLVRRKYLKADETIKNLLDELDNKDLSQPLENNPEENLV